MQDEHLSVGVIGGSGFAGSEFLRLAASHPRISVAWATGESMAGQAIADVYPSLAAAHPNDVFVSYEPGLLAGVDLVVLGLPHGSSQSLVPGLASSVPRIVDLAADFRHRDPSVYDDWYGEAHACPELLAEFVYGLPELYRAEIAGATKVAAPGCYPTSAILPLAPLVRAGHISPGRVVVDAACGVSGAGRPPKPNTTFCAVDENFTAYGVLDHRHTPEMQTHSGATVLFTPHLLPTNRGILSTCYGDLASDADTDDVLSCLADAYADEPFIVVSERLPSTKAVQGSNCAHLSARVDHRTGTVLAFGAIDNLVKGTAGQAIQCINLMAGWDETLALPRVGLTP
jgi:N-acetyl-gamma-glutamyl-phosphate reductase